MMLNNLVNTHDMNRLYRRLAGGDWHAIVAKLRGSSKDRVVRQWSDTDPEPAQWWSIPAVRRRWNLLISGDAGLDFPAYVHRSHLRGRSDLRALSLGCGMGGRELRWAELSAFAHLDAFDISPSQVAVAAERARVGGYADTVRFEVRDFTTLSDDVRYDVILAEHSLHHLAPMPEVVAKIDQLLAPGGLFLVDEYIGPKRFQWTDRQLVEAQSLLEMLPERLRVMGRGTIKRRVIRPSLLWMLLTDPSEAIDSARIAPVLHDVFDVVEERPYGGAVLHLALTDIAQNFLDEDEEASELLHQCFAREDQLMASGAVASDFAALVCRKRDGGPA